MFKSLSFKLMPLLLSSISLMACSNSAPLETQLQEQIIQNANAIIQPWMSKTAPGVAVAISLDDEIILSRGAGLANIELAQPITPDSVFLIASVSKQFTAFATLLLVSEGQIDLDADIRTYIPEMNEPLQEVTVRHLLNHMSGLREHNTLSAMAGWRDNDVRTQAQTIDMITRQSGVNFLAGDKVEYSNTGYVLLAEIVARVSGQSFQSFMEERVFAPLDMTQTAFRESRKDIIPNRTAAYYPNGETFNTVSANSESVGSTGLYTTTIDLLKWAENFETQTVGDDAVFAMMAERATTQSGEASTLAKGQEFRFYNGIKTWSHGGTDEGYKTFILRAPDEDFEVSILSNRHDFDTAKMAFALLDTFLSESPNYTKTPPVEFNLSSPKQLTAYAGDYEFFPGVVFSLRAEKDGLTFTTLGANRDDLEPLPQIGEREFLLNAKTDLSLIFAAPEAGVSNQFNYQIGLHGAITAKRVALEPFDHESVDEEEFIGTYWSDELQTRYTLITTEGKLIARHARLPQFNMTPYQNDMFIGNGPLQKVEFVRGEEGTVTGFHASASLANKIKFTRIVER